MNKIIKLRQRTGKELEKQAIESLHFLKDISKSCCVIANITLPDIEEAHELSNAFHLLQNHVNTWRHTLSPEITSAIPHSIISYYATFVTVSEMIMDITRRHPSAKGKDNEYVIQVKEIANMLQEKIKEIYNSMEKIKIQFADWKQNIQKDSNKFTAVEKGIHEKIFFFLDRMGKDNILIIEYQAALNDPHLAPDKKRDIFEIIEQLKKKNVLAKEKIDDLEVMIQEIDKIVSLISKFHNSLDDFNKYWSLLEGELRDVIYYLDNTDDELIIIIQNFFTKSAVELWKKIVKQVEDLLKNA